MTPQECLTLGRAVAAICPAQKWDEFSPDVWLELLADLNYPDARQAVFALGKAKPFIAPCDIRIEVARLRRRRLEENHVPEPPPGQTVPEYLEWLRDVKAEIADGHLVTGPAPVVGGSWPSVAELTAAMPPAARAIVRQIAADVDEITEESA